MLHELRVENLLLIERAELRLQPGLNVITGETGAGKTVLASALDLLLGGKARAGLVRPGADEAWVEGVFDLPPELREALGERLPADAEDLVLARRVSAEGRSRAYLGGRTCALTDLRDATAQMIAFYGQHEHRKLTLASTQRELLDGACGPEHLAARAAYGSKWAAARVLASSLEELRERAGARDRELDLLDFELAEIEAAAPDEAEERDLVSRRDRLRHLETLQGAALGGAEALAPDDGAGVTSLLATGGSALEGAAGVDPALDALTERWTALAIEASDLAAELRLYGEGLADAGEDAKRLDLIEERLTALDRLKRKHGGTIATVLAHQAACQARRDELAGAEEALEEATAALAAAQVELVSLAAGLRDTRATAAPKLAAAVKERLSALAMEAAVFEVAVEATAEPGPSGADVVEMRIASNPGVPAGPLRDVASGGEQSRVMLALLGVANDGSQATLVFDEIDAGIGGQTARAVGEQLRELADGRQLLCITHLPQIASLAARHFSIAKDVSVKPARTTVQTLEKKEVVAELVRMLGAGEDDVAARRHAKELLKAA